MTLLSVRRGTPVATRPSPALRAVPATAFTIDLLVVVAAALLAALGRRRLGFFDTPADLTDSLEIVGPLIVVGWLAVIAGLGGYRPLLFGDGTEEYKLVLRAGLLTAGMVGVGCYLTKFDLSRGYFLLHFAIGAPALIVGRYALRHAVHRAHRRGALLHSVVIAGNPLNIDDVAAILRRESWLGYRVVGALTPAQHTDEETPGGIPVLGNTEDAVAVVKDHGADIIFFAAGAVSSGRELRRTVWELELDDVQVVVAPNVTDVSSERVRVRPVGGLPLIHIDRPTAVRASRWGKRAFDLAGSTALILLLGPLFLLAALRIKLHDGGPVLFRQTRVGKDGRAFACLKFRTMVTDAEKILARLHAEQGYRSGLFKMKDDPRVTRPGRFMRRYSLDELPQLFNVFRGDMSLVGPRPPLPLEVEHYDPDTVRRLRVRPGMTGLWQVSGRSDLSWSEAVRLDLYYVDNWSMLQDLVILWRTFGAVIRSRGAY